jgi:chemotaxis protein methyltransferase CheR
MSHRAPDSTGFAARGNSILEYEQFRDFLQDSCGILLGDNKQYLVTSRINKLMAKENINSLSELVSKMKQISHRKLKEAVIDAMTTNETLWFRDTHPFEIFKGKLLSEFEEKKTFPTRIWSAACSSGQEPYSLSMLVEEYRLSKMGVLKSPVEIVATDLSQSMLDSCKAAEYDALSLGRGLSKERLQRYFDPLEKDVWRVKSDIKQRVRFQSLNLMDSFISLGKFDAVFCRNVLIYFSAELKADILRRIHGTLRPGGYLILGASEGLTDVSEYYEMVQCRPGIIYRAI